MRSFLNVFVSRYIYSFVLCISTAAHAEFVLEAHTAVLDDNSIRLAVSSGGQTVVLVRDDLTGVYFRVSNDQGVGFQNEKLVDEPPPENIDGLWLDFDSGSVPLMSANGNVTRVLGSMALETDPFFPPPGTPPRLHVSFPRLYGSGSITSVFRYTHKVASISDRCDLQPGLSCSSLRNFDAAMSDDAAHIGVIWNAFGFDDQQGETWFASGEAGDNTFSAPLNLSELVTPDSSGNDFDPRLVMSADGSRLYATWIEVMQNGASGTRFSASLDGGANWGESIFEDDWNANDLAYADDSAELVLVFSTGFYFLEPPAAIKLTQSSDDGASFSVPVTVAVKHVLGDGTEMMPTSPVRVSSSLDGEVIAVLHTEEPCDPFFGCLGGSVLPFDIVLSVSENGGASFDRVGVIAQSYFAQALSGTFDLHVREDGGLIFMVSESAQESGSIFRRAVRQ